MKNVRLRNLIGILSEFPNVDTLLFTGGNSKNGPEYFFRRHLKEYGLRLELISNEVPRIHEFKMSSGTDSEIRTIRTVSLTSASGAANISISQSPLYKQMKGKNPDFNTFDFRVMQYREFF